MSTIIAYILVTSSVTGGAAFSPPLASMEDCRELKRTVHTQNAPMCVEVKIVK